MLSDAMLHLLVSRFQRVQQLIFLVFIIVKAKIRRSGCLVITISIFQISQEITMHQATKMVIQFFKTNMEPTCVFTGMFLSSTVSVAVIACSDVGELDSLGNEVTGCTGTVCGPESAGNVDTGGIAKANSCCKASSSSTPAWRVVVPSPLLPCSNATRML